LEIADSEDDIDVVGMFFLIEFCLTAIAIAAACAFPNLGAIWFEKVEQQLGCLARRRGLAVVVVGLTALVARAALLPIEGIPRPGIHDEFSYLLAADTFAHGRITNPTHPMWVHFETFHVIQQPTYTSKYPPAQGLFLTLGQVLLGHPFWGVWLSVGLMCATICWMLQGWLPPIWALVGGLLALIRLGTFSYWANSYWGGAVAATGGALVLGALPRIKRHQRIRDALLMGLGLAILANSRPYDGLIFSLPVGIALIVWMCRNKRATLGRVAVRIVLPLGLVLAVTGAGMLYYFWRTTGSPFRSPFFLNAQAYEPVPVFPWQSIKPVPAYHHPALRNFYLGLPLAQYEFARSHPSWFVLSRTAFLCFFFIGPVLGLPLFMLGVILPRDMSYTDIGHRTRFLLLVCCVSFVGLLLPIYILPHYAAPVTSALYTSLLLAMQRIRRWRLRGERSGLAIVRAVFASCVVLLLLRAAAPVLHIPVPPTLIHSWCSPDYQNLDRARTLARLEGYERAQLAIVRYKPDHDWDREWVYNAPDIDRAKVVWARDMGSAQNEELISYFKNRQVWLVEPDETPPKLSLIR